MKIRTRIAFWNVQTLHEDYRLAQVGVEILRYKLHILGLSKVRRNEFGEQRTPKGLTLFYSGKKNVEDIRECGVGFLLSSSAKKSLLTWKPVSKRIISVKTDTSSTVLGNKVGKRDEWISQSTWNPIEARKQLHLKTHKAPKKDELASLREQYRQLLKRI
ncbi:unnamed protein product [Euphydryas editha]|uniref:Endonuclease-reverse transcriptase n=1 Tax=Euphydryas editha TaxID=104508 RepID=A0AAU9TY58_EUPED|nr:unnamed protein product [Euphydryas editha]